MIYILLKIILFPFMLIVLRPSVRGWKNLFFRGPAIIVSNHLSLPDPIFIGFLCPRMISFMAKQELFQKPVQRFFLNKCMHAFPVDRDQADMTSLKKAIAVLEAGKVFGIFPEGRRSVTGEMDEIEKGAAFLALRCKVPVIPVYADPHANRNLRVKMIIGEAMDPQKITEVYKGKPIDVVTAVIGDRLQQLRLHLDR